VELDYVSVLVRNRIFVFVSEVLISPYPYLLPSILFDGENISFDAGLAIYNSNNIPEIMIINRMYGNQNLLSL